MILLLLLLFGLSLLAFPLFALLFGGFVLLFFFGLLMDRVFFIFLFLGELFVVCLIDKLSQMNERMNDSIDHKMLVVTDGVGKLQLVLLASFQIAQ